MFSSCVTVNGFNKVMSTPGLTTSIAKSKLGKPSKESSSSDGVKLLYFSRFLDNPMVAAFENDQLVQYGHDNDYFYLDLAYRTGAIDTDEYRWRYQMLVEEENARRAAALQAFGIYQNMQYQKQSLGYQRDAIRTLNQPASHQGTMRDQFGNTYTYQGTSRSQGYIIPNPER